MWTLEGADADDFTITGGMLKFSSAPDYENPMGGADDDSNTYMVTVKAEAGGEEAMQEVTVMVTNEEELGTLTADMVSPIEHPENSMDTVATYTASGPMADNAMWTLEGADADDFTITGGMLKFSSAPDYENPMGGADDDSNTYMVTVKAEAGGEEAMQEVTVMVTNEEELGTLTADMVSPIEHPENSMDTVATYTASGPMADNAMWTLEGADADDFTITGGMLKFSSAPDYENPMGGADDDSNTYMVTVKAEAGGEEAMQEVTVMVTNEEELGTLTADMVSPIEHPENSMDTVATYTASGPMADNAMWTLEGADADDFTITGGMLKFSSAPDYENPMGGADDDSNTYMVTVKAEAGGEMDMLEVTVMVTNVVELGTLIGPVSPIEHPENSMDTVATYTASGPMADNAMWTLEGADADDFTITGGMLKFSSAPDYENPMGGADDDSNTYMVTVKAEAGGEMDMLEVTVMVTNVNETPEFGSDTYGFPVGEDANVGDSVGTVTATDVDEDTLAYSITAGNDGDSFAIDDGTGAITVEADLDYEDTPSYTLTVQVADGNEGTATATVNITVTDVNEAPVFPSATVTRSVLENQLAGRFIGDPVAATDPDGDTLTYGLEGTDAASFGIDGSTGQLRTSAALDYETKTAYIVVVKATDPGGLSATTAVTINVTDVDEEVPAEVPAIVQRYDTDGTPGISIAELFAAIDDYFENRISIAELFEVIDAYFASNG